VLAKFLVVLTLKEEVKELETREWMISVDEEILANSKFEMNGIPYCSKVDSTGPSPCAALQVSSYPGLPKTRRVINPVL